MKKFKKLQRAIKIAMQIWFSNQNEGVTEYESVELPYEVIGSLCLTAYMAGKNGKDYPYNN